jgi:hypothetical protein
MNAEQVEHYERMQLVAALAEKLFQQVDWDSLTPEGVRVSANRSFAAAEVFADTLREYVDSQKKTTPL